MVSHGCAPALCNELVPRAQGRRIDTDLTSCGLEQGRRCRHILLRLLNSGEQVRLLIRCEMGEIMPFEQGAGLVKPIGKVLEKRLQHCL